VLGSIIIIEKMTKSYIIKEYLDYICIIRNIFIYSHIISLYNVDFFEVVNLSLNGL